MATKPLPFVSYSLDAHCFEIGERGFQELEKAYQTPIPTAARDRLINIGRAFLNNRQSELAQESWRDVQSKLPPFQAAARALWEITYEKGPHSDAQAYFDALFYRHLGEQLVSIIPARGDLRILTVDDEGWTPFNEKFQAPQGSYAIRFTHELFASLAMSLTVAVKKVEEEIVTAMNDPAPLPRRQTAIDEFILQLREWAETFELPKSPYIDGEYPAKFACFACRLLQFAPDEFRDRKFSTDAAMAAQIRRTREAARRYRREQKQQSILVNDAPLGSK
jgi:hypothetical protein